MLELFYRPGGTGDGLTPATATGSKNALLTALAADRANPISGTPRVIPWDTVVPGIDTDYDQSSPDGGMRAYVPLRQHCVERARINFITDQGVVDIGDTSPWLTLTADHGGVAGAGTSTDPHELVVWTGYRSSDGKRTHEVPGGTETRSVTMRCKDPAVDWTSTSFYSGNKWIGPTVLRTFTWTVQKPSPIRVVFRGNRTPDPRTNKLRQIWNNGDNATRLMQPGDPDSYIRNRVIKKSDGTNLTMIRGDVYDLDEKTLINYGWERLGNECFLMNAPFTIFQGFEFRNLAAPFAFGGNLSPLRFQGFRDIRTDNTRFGIRRGHLHSDVLWDRWHSTTVAQKLASIGVDCYRWLFRDMHVDWQFNIGDGTVQAGLVAAADSSEGAAMMLVHRAIFEHGISGIPSGDNLYVNADGTDNELRGASYKHTYGFNIGDGLHDAKSGAMHAGWNAVTVADSYTRKVKRPWRSWTPAGDVVNGRVLSGRWVMRDCTHEDTTDTGLITFNKPLSATATDLAGPDAMIPFDKIVDWENPSGRPYAQGRKADDANIAAGARRPSMQHNDAELLGPQLVIQRRYHDERPNDPVDQGPTTFTSSDGLYKYVKVRPVANPKPVGVKVNGVTVESGHRVLVKSGETVKIEPGRALAEGETVEYRVLGDADETRSGNVLSVPFKAQA